MGTGDLGNDLSTITVTGLKDGRPCEVRWFQGALYGRGEDVLDIRELAASRAGEEVFIHPEGTPIPVGLDTYRSAWATIPLAFSWVEEIDGPEPDSGRLEDGDTTTEMDDREYASARKWTPSLHPRWPKGTSKAGKFMTKGEIAEAKKRGGLPGQTPQRAAAARARANPEIRGKRPRARPIPIPKDPASKGAITTSDPKEAARLLAEGKAVNLKQPRQVSILLDELAKIVADAEAKGDKAPNYDLCKVTVQNTSLFCVESKGIPRIEMPQLKGIPEKGSVADRMKKDDKGEVDLTERFLDHLRRGGFETTDTEEHAAYLRASQNELNGGKVAGMVKWMRGGGDPHKGGRMLVSEDNYIVDGHHRWAATVALDAEDNRLGDDKAIPITRIDIDIIKLLREAVLYANANGIPNAGFTKSNPANK